MRGVDTVVDGVMDHSRAVIAVMLVLTVVLGSGATMVEQTSSLDQFQTESAEGDALDYAQANFSTDDDDTTTAQVIVRDEGGDVLDKESLVGIIDYQQTLDENETVAPTLAGDRPTISIANAVAIASISAEEGEDVQQVAAELRALNGSVTEEQAAIERRNETLSTTTDRLNEGLTTLRQNPNASIDAEFESIRADSSVEFDDEDAETFRTAAQQLRNASSEEEAREAYRLGTRGVLDDEYTALEDRVEALRSDVDRLEELSAELETEQQEYDNASNATLAEQREQLQSLNESELNDAILLVLGEDAGTGGSGGQIGAFGLMPTDYEPGSTDAEATMIVVTMEGSGSAAQGTAGDDVIDAQLAMQDLGDDAAGGEYLTFGAGIISEEITN